VRAYRLTARMSTSRRLFWGMIFTFLITGGLLFLGVFLFSPNLVSANQFLDVSLRSPLFADYGLDERGARLPQMDLGLAVEAARDRIPTAGPSGETSLAPINPATTLVKQLMTPVPTVTPGEINFWPTLTPGTTVETIFTTTPFASATIGPQPTVHLSATASITPSPTLGIGVTAVSTRTPTRTPENTLVVPTRTPLTPTPAPVLPTQTMAPWTSTPAPLPPTRTPVPPTTAPTKVPTKVPTNPPAPTDPPAPTAYPLPTDPPQPTDPPYPYP
jgi:hypothetical protein